MNKTLHPSGIERVTVPSILNRKRNGPKIVMLTAYDFSMARLLDQSEVDMILVGDSLGSVFQGLETTLPVTLEEMIYHSRAVVRGTTRALVVGDMPFMSYQSSEEKALESAGALLKQGGVAAVKLEGGVHVAKTIERLVQVDIPVVGHIGLTPQSYHRMGGHKVQGKKSGKAKDAGTKERILDDAKAVAEAGAFAVVLEGMPSDLASEITNTLSIPTIGIGAGPDCDGQVLVVNDLLGMDPHFTPKFVKRYAELGTLIPKSVKEYANEVRSGQFPSLENSFGTEKQAATAKVRPLKLV